MEMRLRSRALDKIYKRRDRYEIPDWQREEVWTTAKKQKLIDSVLRGWKLPKFYLLKTSESPEEYEVLDGQQRLASIWEFLENELVLDDDSAKAFGGRYYKELPDDISDAFDDYEIDFDEITAASEADQKEFFQRLQEGLPLTSSEKLNSIHSKLRDFCEQLSKHKFFDETASISSRRYAYFDVCAKVMALEVEDLDAGIRFEDIRKIFKQQKSFSGNSAAAKRAKLALEVLHKELPSSYGVLRNRTMVQSVITFVCHLLRGGMEKSQHKTVGKFINRFLIDLNQQVELGQDATDQDFLNYQRTVNANVRSGPKARNDILLKKLFQAHPEFYSESAQSKTLSAGLLEQVCEAAKSIRHLITQANEHYAAKHGVDLFKPTNKTINALTSRLDGQVKNHDEYMDLIKNLYFLSRESIGQRLHGNTPQSFLDINDLRTLNQHDIDHGKTGKVAKKRIHLAAVFKKYSGETSPESIDPGKFLVVQGNLYAALETDLRALLKGGFSV